MRGKFENYDRTMDLATCWLLEDSFLAKSKARSFLLQSYSNRFGWSQVTRHKWIAPGICCYKKGCVCWKRFAYLIEPSAWPWNPLNLQTAESVFGQEGLWGRAPLPSFAEINKSNFPSPNNPFKIVQIWDPASLGCNCTLHSPDNSKERASI